MNKQDADRMNKALQTLYDVCEEALKRLYSELKDSEGENK